MINGFCINIKRRIDRREKMQTRLSALSCVDVEFFEALENLIPPIGWQDLGGNATAQYSATMSHKAVMEEAKKRNYPYVLVLEDDVIFCRNFDDELKKLIQNLPDNWDMLFLGATRAVSNNLTRKHFNNLFWQTRGELGNWAMLVRNTMYDKFIDTYTTAKVVCDHAMLDGILHSRKHNFFVAKKYLCKVEGDYSDLVERNRAKDYIIKDIETQFIDQ